MVLSLDRKKANSIYPGILCVQEPTGEKRSNFPTQTYLKTNAKSACSRVCLKASIPYFKECAWHGSLQCGWSRGRGWHCRVHLLCFLVGNPKRPPLWQQPHPWLLRQFFSKGEEFVLMGIRQRSDVQLTKWDRGLRLSWSPMASFIANIEKRMWFIWPQSCLV